MVSYTCLQSDVPALHQYALGLLPVLLPFEVCVCGNAALASAQRQGPCSSSATTKLFHYNTLLLQSLDPSGCAGQPLQFHRGCTAVSQRVLWSILALSSTCSLTQGAMVKTSSLLTVHMRSFRVPT